MTVDLTEIFAKYERLVAEADALFERVRSQHADCVTCGLGCSDCCHALFDLGLVEAMYLNQRFAEAFGFGAERSAILERADAADRHAVRLKRRLYKESLTGRDSAELLAEVARERIRCPLLGDDETCAMYAHRPITCRLYGIPTAIGGVAHTCGRTGFAPGGRYPTVALDKIHERLAGLSREILVAVQSRYRELDQVYVPVSMALITRYDNAYLGIGPVKKES